MQIITEHFIDNCKKANPKAQRQLFEMLYAPLYRVCLRYLNHKEDAEDCLMKGFLKAFQNISSFRYEGEGSLQGWLRKIMVNECLMALRKRSSLLFLPEEDLVETELPADVLQRIEAEALNTLVMKLPVGYRTVFNLFAVEGYTHKEVAQLLNITENTSKSQFSKARLRLRQLLEQQKLPAYGKFGK